MMTDRTLSYSKKQVWSYEDHRTYVYKIKNINRIIVSLHHKNLHAIKNIGQSLTVSLL